jgi:hypothetical protein
VFLIISYLQNDSLQVTKLNLGELVNKICEIEIDGSSITILIIVILSKDVDPELRHYVEPNQINK